MSGFAAEQIKALAAPLSSSKVKSRAQGGQTLSYIEAWHAIDEANRIFGFDGWNREMIELRQLGDVRIVLNKYGKEQARVGYSARVRITVLAGDRFIVREGCGFGSGIDADPDQAHESALKEAESDAMKRALMTFGNPFGLALYDKAQANVERDAPKLAERPKQQAQATPFDDEPPAKDRAIAEIKNCASIDELTAVWKRNYSGWTQYFNERDMKDITSAKDARKAALLPNPTPTKETAA
jgi:DNA repair and recombination protein RAD52